MLERYLIGWDPFTDRNMGTVQNTGYPQDTTCKKNPPNILLSVAAPIPLGQCINHSGHHIKALINSLKLEAIRYGRGVKRPECSLL